MVSTPKNNEGFDIASFATKSVLAGIDAVAKIQPSQKPSFTEAAKKKVAVAAAKQSVRKFFKR